MKRPCFAAQTFRYCAVTTDEKPGRAEGPRRTDVTRFRLIQRQSIDLISFIAAKPMQDAIRFIDAIDQQK
jgi:hypothetical protein